MRIAAKARRIVERNSPIKSMKPPRAKSLATPAKSSVDNGAASSQILIQLSHIPNEYFYELEPDLDLYGFNDNPTIIGETKTRLAPMNV